MSIQAGEHERRPTIGLLVAHLIHKNDCALWQGVVEAAGRREANVICFEGLWLKSPTGSDARANAIYDLVGAQTLDGLVIYAGSITQFVAPDEKRAFLDRFLPLPMVTLESEVPGPPNIRVDSLSNMKKAVHHLVRHHGYRRIAFIRGPHHHQGANDRYRAYVETLAEHDIPFDPSLVTPPLDWYAGRAGLSWLLDHHASFEAVVGANDDSAIGAIEELQARGIRVPEEVAVVGYDDAAPSRWISPPLTTVPIETYQWGQRAVEMVLDLIDGKSVPEMVIIPTEVVVRQSCGCGSPSVEQAMAGPLGRQDGRPEEALASQRPRLLSVIARALGGSGEHPDGSGERLLDGFLRELTGKTPGPWTRELNQALTQVPEEANGDASAWQEVISVLRRVALPSLKGKMLARAEDLWHGARVAISEAAQRTQAQMRLRAAQNARVLQEIGAALLTTSDVRDVANVLAQGLPRVGVPSAFLALYENPESDHPPQWSRLMLAYSEKGRVELEAEGRRFPSRALLPRELVRQDRPYSLVVEPLYSRSRQIGFFLAEMGPREGDIYGELRTQISGALEGAFLAQRVRERSAELARQQHILDAFMDAVPDPISFKDLDSRIMRANRAHAALLGLRDPAEEIGKSDFDFLPEETARKRYEEERDIVRTGLPLLNREESDGLGHWALTTKMPLRDERGEIFGTFVISHDITDHRRLEESNRQLASLVESASDAILGLDKDHRITTWNKGAERTYGYLAEEVIGRPVSILVPPELDDDVDLLRGRPPRGEHLSQYETTRIRKDGKRITVSLTISIVRDGSGGVTGYASIARDITEQKAIQAQIDRARRLESLVTLARGVSHQFNNINTALKGYLDLLLKEKELPSRLRSFTQAASAAVERSVDITDRLLALTEIPRAGSQPARLDLLAREALARWAARIADEQVRVVTEIEETPSVAGNEARLRFVLVSLLGNALDALTGRALRIMTVRTGAEGDASFFEVEDTGCGIPSDDLPRIFTPLFSAKGEWAPVGSPQARLKGVGLSLSICNATVTEYGGRIDVRSEHGTGSTFRVLIPSAGTLNSRDGTAAATPG